jgi:hypothetical protein
VNYRYRVRKRSNAVLRSMGITHVVYDRPLEGNDRNLQGQLEVIGRYGVFTFARLLSEPREHAVAPGTGLDPDLTGSVGGLRATTLEREHLVFEVEEAKPGATLRLNLGDYRKWVVTGPDGPLERSVRERFGGVPATAVTLERPGRIEFRYRRPMAERVTGWISLGFVMLAFVGLFFGRPLVFRPWSLGPTPTRVLGAVGAVGAVVVLVLALRHQSKQLTRTWMTVAKRHAKHTALGNEDPKGFIRDVVVAGRFRVWHQNPRRCDGLLGKDALAECNERGEKARISMEYRAPYLYRCLDVQVEPGGSTEVGFFVDGLAMGFIRDAGPKRGNPGLTFRVPGREEFGEIGRRRKHFQVEPREHQGELVVELRNDSPAIEHVCIALAEIR